MDGQRIGVIQDVPDSLVYIIWSGDGGIAQGIVVDILGAHNGGPLTAVFKQITDDAAVGAQGVGFFVVHKDNLLRKKNSNWNLAGSSRLLLEEKLSPKVTDEV